MPVRLTLALAQVLLQEEAGEPLGDLQGQLRVRRLEAHLESPHGVLGAGISGQEFDGDVAAHLQHGVADRRLRLLGAVQPEVLDDPLQA